MAIYLIDYENTKDLTGINNLNSDDVVVIFYSQKANALSFDAHREIMASKAKIEYKCVTVGGQNALDFQLSSYLGYLIKQNENKAFQIYIISKDKGFSFVKSFWKQEKSIDILISNNLANPEQGASSDATKPAFDIKDVLKKSDVALSESEIQEIATIVSKYKSTQTINGYLNKLLKDSAKTGIVLKLIKPFIKKQTVSNA